MIKRLYLVNGNLTQPLAKDDEDIAVDVATSIQLATLNIGDWCYLTLLEEDKLEVVKITKFPSWYWVDRAQDGTTQFGFSVNAKIIYRLTNQEIQDSIVGVPFNIYPDGYSAIEVNSDTNSWQIDYRDINIQTLGGVSWMNPDIYEVVITDNNGMFGCCDGNLTGAPFAGGIPFYLTSQLYSYFGMDIISPTPKDENGNSIPPVNPKGWWLLDQPQPVEKYMGIYGQLSQLNLYGGAVNYPYYMDQYINMNGYLLAMNLYGGAKNIPPYVDQYMAINGYLLVMNMFGSAVNYSNRYIDLYMNTSGELLSMSLN